MSRLPEEVLSVPLPRSPGFPVDLGGAGELHAAFLIESRTCSLGWSHVQEIRVAAFVFLDVERLLRRHRGEIQRLLSNWLKDAEKAA